LTTNAFYEEYMDVGATLKTQIHISQLTARQELALNAREMTAGKWK
jgi:hypothetical protein